MQMFLRRRIKLRNSRVYDNPLADQDWQSMVAEHMERGVIRFILIFFDFRWDVNLEGAYFGK